MKRRTTTIKNPETKRRKARSGPAPGKNGFIRIKRARAAVPNEPIQLKEQVADLSQRLDSLVLQLDRALDCQDFIQSMLDEIRELLRLKGLTENELSPYKGLVPRVHHLVRQHVPRNARLLVVSKGDPELIKINGRQACHFPYNSAREYAGYHPACDLAAIAHLEFARSEGAEYFVVPQTALWWFEHYAAFRRHLDRCYQRIAENQDIAVIYSLRAAPTQDLGPTAHDLVPIVDELRSSLHREPAILDCQSGLALAQNLPQLAVFQPPSQGDRLPYLDKSVDLVVAPSDSRYAPSETRRIASGAVVTAPGNGTRSAGKLLVEWVDGQQKRQCPMISIIIPSFQNLRTNQFCLRSLLETLPDTITAEVLIVDSTSGGDSSVALNQSVTGDSRLRFIRRRRSNGWADDCRHVSSHAKGEILIFLRSGVLLLPGWLPPILHVFKNFPQAGAVGGRLISSVGHLQAAGGLVFRDGSAWGFGSGDFNLQAALYNYVREVDYCSALLATRRSVWEDLAGFDTRYSSGTHAEIDYCLRLRTMGYRVYYQPEAAAVLCSGDLAGQPVSVGESNGSNDANQKILADRWAQELLGQPARPDDMSAAWQDLAFARAAHAKREEAV